MTEKNPLIIVTCGNCNQGAYEILSEAAKSIDYPLEILEGDCVSACRYKKGATVDSDNFFLYKKYGDVHDNHPFCNPIGDDPVKSLIIDNLPIRERLDALWHRYLIE